MSREKVTSVDVARHAGVSQSAVSRVFTPGASASASVRAKVLKAAAELGYRPNPIARAMITGKSRIVGLMVAYLDNQFYPLALEKLSYALQARGYHILLFMVPQRSREIGTIVQELMDYQVEGIVTASVSMSNELTGLCVSAGIPIVLFNRGQDDPRLTTVTSDNIGGGRAVANFLVAGGHDRIAHIAGWQESSTGRDRTAGLIAGLKDHGREPVAVVDGMYDRDTAASLTRDLFGRPDRPDAVFVGNDHMAFAVMDVLRHELGLSVPGDVSVVGYDDVPIAAWPSYALTTIRQPVNRMVDATIDALMSRIEGDTQPRKFHIAGSLMIRGSARTPKV
ncbi:LacI family DNA-binding transcriptional regulator [Paracoccus stylophorae]|uniref:LacI family DNA-binding transcriptional regulator n=1 Tax=Paracoccus stylophorae TaxID=659350 RepID=A0ABY7SXA2_9RHOB|nr:LacI family DNA-binding transcriptional regulator [Paracoccus stylophorae]WCR11503.1 LacI family DNA-binding transcriptional regulator [Paracoccus stylophorae]